MPPVLGSLGQALAVRGVSVHFGGVQAVEDVDLDLAQGEILGLIGPNGAGKTTLVNAITGFVRPARGKVTLGGADVTGWPPDRLARSGVGRTFQGARVFRELTVQENVEVGFIGTSARRRVARREARVLLTEAGLDHLADVPAGTLPFGVERRVGLLRTLAQRPSVLLLDEPAAGLNERESDELGQLLLAIPRRDGCGLVVIEHDVRLILRLCDRVQVLDHGRTIAVAAPAVVRRDPAVVLAYLGEEDADAAHL